MALWLLLLGVSVPGAGRAWPVGGVFVAPTPSGGQEEPRLILGKSGSVLAYWSDERWLEGFDLYGQLLTPSGLVAPGWPDTGLMIARAFDDQRSGAGLADPDGSFIVGIMDFRNALLGGTSIDSYLSRVLPSGAIDPAWPRQGFQAVNRVGQDVPEKMLWVAPDTLITACFYAQPDALGRPLLQQVAITPSGPTLPWGRPGSSTSGGRVSTSPR
jgi:hypothetical protein